ncbi:MAG TPA: DMT family transporter [Candidatus Angelobacter sp.]|nr:DMT family transporter [Candidatus Angelobacter sp.]
MANSQARTFTRGQLLGYLSLCLIWGSTWLAIRVVVHDVPPFKAAALRFVAAAVLLLVAALAQKRRWPQDGREWAAVLVLSFTMMAVPYGLLFWAEQHVMSSMTAIFYSAMPLTVALLTPAMMHRKVPRTAVYAMVIAFGALLSLFITELSASRRSIIGGVLVVVSMALSSWSAVYAKIRLRNIDPVVATGLQLMFGSVVLLWAAWVFEAHRPAVWSRTAVIAMAFLTLFGSAAAFVIYYWLLKRLQPYQLSTISLITPVIALLEGWLWGEPVRVMMVVAIVVVLGSVRVVLRAEAELKREDDNILMLRDGAQ